MYAKRRSISDRIPEEPIDALARRPTPAPKRDRTWEAKQRRTAGVATYRGVPRDLQEEVKAVAAELGVTVGAVARLFLSYGLEAYKSGELTPDVVEVTKKRTLSP